MKKMKLLNQRRKHALTQTDVARHLGIAPSAYCRIENGQTLLTEPVLIRLCSLYDCNIADLLELQNNAYVIRENEAVDYARLFACVIDLHEAQQQRLDQFHALIALPNS